MMFGQDLDDTWLIDTPDEADDPSVKVNPGWGMAEWIKRLRYMARVCVNKERGEELARQARVLAARYKKMVEHSQHTP